jgi:hypothetical protein
MRNRTPVVLLALAVLLPLPASPTPANATQQQVEPAVGQAGKDVIWVPTPEKLVLAMLDMAKVTASDTLIDLGSGDGRIVIAAAKRGARAVGIEYNPDMVELSRRNALKAGVSGRASFLRADVFRADFSQATVLTMYLLPELNMKLRPGILRMKPGTRVISHAFTFGDWNADRTVSVEGRSAYLWIVPAKVAGTWTWPKAELILRQGYQRIAGSLKLDGQELPFHSARLEGDSIRIAFTDPQGAIREYSGRVAGATIQGTVRIGRGLEVKWTAVRRPIKARGSQPRGL